VSRRTRIPGMSRKGSVLCILPEIPDDAPEILKNALALRNACATEGRCPSCGTTPDLLFDGHGIGHLTFRHDDDCPALRDDLSYGGQA
jgi:hypothetical protein